MSSHPYRQKAVTLTSAPYPVDDFNESRNTLLSLSSPQEGDSRLSEEYGIPPEDPPDALAIGSPQLESEFHTPIDNDGSPYTGHKDHLSGVKQTPYPIYEAQTPPPVFAKDGPITSPPSNPLSATSSVTNLNISGSKPQFNNLNGSASGSNIGHTAHSRSDNNLLASVTDTGKYGHTRSVSSMSSFFYDRNDNASMVDFSQNIIQLYLGDNSNHLLPRIKTIELYRKNAKKSNDPTVLFQYAQYMLQTALMLDLDGANGGGSISQVTSGDGSSTKMLSDKNRAASSSALALDKMKKASHSKSKSTNSLDLGNLENAVDDKMLKKALLKEAVFYLKKLADKGYVEAQYLLADAYSSGALGKVDNREAFTLFQAAAKHGHIESAFRTSYCYEEGLGTGRDARKAVEYLRMAASKNHAAAMYKLGVYSFYGRMGLSSSIDTKKIGIKWLTRACSVATELTAAAPYELGKIFFNGFHDIVIADKKYSLELYSQAAALGHVRAAALLGQFYEFGDIVPQDLNLSIHYYTQAALGGDPESMLAMCAWYLVGNEPHLQKDENEAFEWAKRAAMCNFPKAQYALGNFYEKGIGCIKNHAESQMWYRKAVENGDEKSLSRVDDKEFVAKMLKKLKKHSSTSRAAQEKDCIIM